MDTGFQLLQQATTQGPQTLFNNRAGLAYYYTTVAPTDEYIDEAAFPASGVDGSDQVSGLTFEYCATNGVTLDTELRFWRDTTTGSGPSAWTSQIADHGASCFYQLLNLPSGTGCWAVTVDLRGGFECTLPQELQVGSLERFAWAMIYLDPSNQTGPILDTNLPGAVPGYGNLDSFEWFDLNQAFGSEHQGSFSFGGIPKAQGSFALTLTGPRTDTKAYYSQAPLPLDRLILTSQEEVRPQTNVTWQVENPIVGQNYFLLLGAQPFDMPALALGGANLLVAPPSLLAAPQLMGPLASYSALTPTQMPSALYVQAVEYSGTLQVTSTTAASQGLRHSN